MERTLFERLEALTKSIRELQILRAEGFQCTPSLQQAFMDRDRLAKKMAQKLKKEK